MADDVPASRTQRLIKGSTDSASKVDINPELKELFAQLVEATLAVRDAARMVREKPSPSMGRRFLDLDLQMDAIIRRIDQILE
jgi:hypothetical protein